MTSELSPSQIVDSFIKAVESKQIDVAIAHLAEDVSYENMPISPIVGRENVAKSLGRFLGPASSVEWRVLRQMTDGRVVANERLDRFEMAGGWIELAVAGFFEVSEAGLITLWRDYFDMSNYQTQLAEVTPRG